MEAIHLVATAFMAGVTVFVQVVHYPLMAGVGAAEFASYERAHTVRTGWVVIPAMLVELGSAVWLAAGPRDPAAAALAYTGLGLLFVVWISTGVLQAPAHGRLVSGFDAGVHRRLVLTNWIRTVAWLARVPLAVLLLPA